jgi:hypothetical protein
MAEKDSLTLLAEEVARILNVEKVDPDVGINELGVDSLNVVELMLVADQLYPGADVEKLSAGLYTSLRDFDQQLRQQMAA